MAKQFCAREELYFYIMSTQGADFFFLKSAFSIHQPSAELFQEFDRLLLLKKGGQTVYFGDIGNKSTTLIDYFQNNGGQSCPPDANP